jgi:hypothetical protein
VIETYLDTSRLQNKRAETPPTWDETGWAGDEKNKNGFRAYY